MTNDYDLLLGVSNYIQFKEITEKYRLDYLTLMNTINNLSGKFI